MGHRQVKPYRRLARQDDFLARQDNFLARQDDFLALAGLLFGQLPVHGELVQLGDVSVQRFQVR
jgi:hypothetical protein